MHGVSRKGIAGFIMLEVLASLVIIGLTIVLITNVHSRAVKTAYDSLQRGRAVWMAREMMERMRVNISSINTYVTIASVAADPSAFCATDTNKCLTGQCTVNEIVRFDVEQVICNSTGINNPRFRLTCSTPTCTNNSTITVRVLWDSIGGLSGPITETQEVSLEMMR